jgi:chromate reductase, NAD(P)H dehydrogenase (quinone)
LNEDALRVAILVGSLRRGSFSRKVAHAAIALAPDSLVMEIVEIGDLPLYNEDLEDAPARPPSWLMFRDCIRRVDGVLFVTPEYNRSVPGALKNALDVGSRPRVENVWRRKPSAVISVSLGALGAFGANHHLRQSFVFLDMPTMQQPEAYIGNASSLFDSQGALAHEKTREFIQTIVTAFEQWIRTNGHQPFGP